MITYVFNLSIVCLFWVMLGTPQNLNMNNWSIFTSKKKETKKTHNKCTCFQSQLYFFQVISKNVLNGGGQLWGKLFFLIIPPSFSENYQHSAQTCSRRFIFMRERAELQSKMLMLQKDVVSENRALCWRHADMLPQFSVQCCAWMLLLTPIFFTYFSIWHAPFFFPHWNVGETSG